MLERRSLDDPELRTFLEANLGHAVSQWPMQTWDLGTLSLAALYFSPVLDSGRARVAETEAAIATAGARPNPTLSLSPGVPSPYLASLDFAVPIETAGKRGHRIQSARSLDQAAQLDLADFAWKIHSAVRSALLDYLHSSSSLETLHSEEHVRVEQVRLLCWVCLGLGLSRTEVDLARIELSKTHLAISTTEGQVAQTRAALAASIGVSVGQLQGREFSWRDLDSPPNVESLTAQEIQRNATLNRLDVRRALAQYAAAEADLQLEIAKQYPDLQIGPGYTYEEGHSFFTLGLSTTLPLFNRNQGPIAEAEARRKAAAAAFLEKQAQVIRESERAFGVYTAAVKELAEADQSLHKLQDTQQKAIERAVRVGEEDPLALDGVRIESSVVARLRLDALSRAQTALGALEDAVQRPLAPGDAFPADPESPALRKAPKELNR